jgi:hypothetical protein
MAASLVEYVVARHCEGWNVLRDGTPIGRRGVLVRALDFATHLAEREATRGGRATRVLMACEDTLRLPGCQPLRRAA